MVSSLLSPPSLRYPVPDCNKTMINNTKEPSNAHKNILKEEILQEITENFMEKNTRHG
jgi:hypothetical protein